MSKKLKSSRDLSALRRLSNFGRGCLCLSLALGSMQLTLVLVPTIWLALGGRISVWQFPLAVLVFFGVLLYLFRRHEGRGSLCKAAALSLLGLAGLAGSVLFFSRTIDFSPDGQATHAPAIYELLSGWNAVRDPRFLKIHEVVPQDYPLFGAHEDYSGAAAKFPYFSRAALAKLTASIEGSKALNLLGPILVFAYAAACFEWVGLSLWIGRGLAVLIALSPIFLTQINSNYVDHFVGAFFVVAALTTLVIEDEVPDEFRWASVLALLLMMASKLNGVIMGGAVFLFLNWVSRLQTRRLWFRGRQWVGLSLAGSILFIHPYVTNLYHFKNPIYPMSAGNRRIIGSDLGPFYTSSSRAEGLFYTLFSESSLSGTPALKWPWEIRESEADAFRLPDTRIAGMGPYFTLALLISLTLVAAAWGGGLSLWRRPLQLAAFLFFLACILPVTYWLRFSPQLWLVSPLLIIAAREALSRTRWGKALAALWVLVMFIDIGFVANASIGTQVKVTKKFRDTMMLLRGLPQPLTVRFSNFNAGKWRLAEEGIRFKEVSECPEGPRLFIVFSENQICLDPIQAALLK